MRLEPAEAREVVFELGREDFEMLNARMERVVEPGAFRIMVGASSEDIRSRGFLRAPPVVGEGGS